MCQILFVRVKVEEEKILKEGGSIRQSFSIQRLVSESSLATTWLPLCDATQDSFLQAFFSVHIMIKKEKFHEKTFFFHKYYNSELMNATEQLST